MTFRDKIAARLLLLVAYLFAPDGMRWQLTEIAREIQDCEPLGPGELIGALDLKAAEDLYTPDADDPALPAASIGYNKRVLANIRALMLGKTLDDVALYKIGGRELTKIPIPDLLKLEASFEARVTRQIRRMQRRGAQAATIEFGGGW